MSASPASPDSLDSLDSPDFLPMRIIPIILPTPFYIGPVNVYLIKEDPVTLIDTGPKTREALDALRAGQRQAQIVQLLPRNGATAWEVSRALFPDTDDVHRFLAVSEAVAHLDYMSQE